MAACPTCGHVVPGAPDHVFTLERKLPSANERSVNANTARFHYRKERDAWGWLLKVAMIQHGIPRANEKRRLRIVRVLGKGEREYDFDNLVGGAKALVDAMARAGLVLNDNARWLEASYHQERGSATGVRIEVSEVAR